MVLWRGQSLSSFWKIGTNKYNLVHLHCHIRVCMLTGIPTCCDRFLLFHLLLPARFCSWTWQKSSMLSNALHITSSLITQAWASLLQWWISYRSRVLGMNRAWCRNLWGEIHKMHSTPFTAIAWQLTSPLHIPHTSWHWEPMLINTLTLEAKTRALQIKCLRCIPQSTYWSMCCLKGEHMWFLCTIREWQNVAIYTLSKSVSALLSLLFSSSFALLRFFLTKNKWYCITYYETEYVGLFKKIEYRVFIK